MTNPINNQNQMSNDLSTSSSNFRFLPGEKSSMHGVTFIVEENLDAAEEMLIFESDPEIEIVDNLITESLTDSGAEDSENGDFRLPEDFTLTFSPEISTGVYGELFTDSTGNTVASVDATCSAVKGVNIFEIRVVKKNVS